MKNKSKIILALVGVVMSIALLVASIILTESEIINLATATLIAIAVVLVWIAIFYVAKIEYETGVYECRKCGHTFKPTFKAFFGEHILLKQDISDAPSVIRNPGA